AAFQKDPQYPLARRYFERQREHASKSRLRVGVIEGQFSGYRDYDEEVRRDFDAALGQLRSAGLEIVSVPDVEFLNDIHLLHQHIYCKALSYYFQAEVS